MDDNRRQELLEYSAAQMAISVNWDNEARSPEFQSDFDRMLGIQVQGVCYG